MAIMVTCSAETRRARRLQRELNGARRRWREKQRKGGRATGGRSRLNRWAKSGGEWCAWHAMEAQTRRSQRWCLRACVEAGGNSPTVSVCLLALFKVFTELPFASFLKLLSNLYGNSKISKNKSCSKFKVLQLCFNNHTQILSRFENESLKSKGDTLRIYPLWNYFKFYITTSKTLKTNFVHIDKLYTFSYRLIPKLCLDFELGIPG